jgi:hypothetical protein
VIAARTDPNVVKQLGLNSLRDELNVPDGRPRNLTSYEVEALAKALGQPDLTTQRQVFKAMHNQFIDPVLTSEAIRLVGDFYWSAPCVGGDEDHQRQIFISASRVVEALIMKASGDVKIESGKTGRASASHAEQASH